MRVAMYWHNGRSLGHTAGSAKVAHALVAGLEDVRIAGLTGAWRGLDLLPPQVDVIRLPGFANFDSPTGWHLASRLGLPADEFFRLRAELAEVFVRGFRPDVFFSNHLPAGEEGELRPALSGHHHRYGVLTLRGILFDRDKTNQRYFQGAAAEWIAEHYQVLAVHAPAEVVRLEDHYDVPPWLLERVRYLGYLPGPSSRDRRECRAALGWREQDRWAVASMGGGQGAGELWDQVVAALLAHRDQLDGAVLVTGPYLEPDAAAELRRAVQAHPWISVVEYTAQMATFMQAADVCIAAAGSNTIAEALAVRANVVLIPRQVREVEQQVHTRLVCDAGYARMCDRTDVLAGGLTAVLTAALDAPLHPHTDALLGGARRYPALLRALVDGPAS